ISYEEYHPYGTSAYRAVNSRVDVSERTYRYTGKERDEETGLGYHGARYYACWLGRWTASDPIGLGDGVNRYAYVSGRPISLHDPAGTKGEGDSYLLATARRFEKARQKAERRSEALDEKIDAATARYEATLRAADQERVSYLDAEADRSGIYLGGRVVSQFEQGQIGPQRVSDFRTDLLRIKYQTKDLPYSKRAVAIDEAARKGVGRISWRSDAVEELALMEVGMTAGLAVGMSVAIGNASRTTVSAPAAPGSRGSTSPDGTGATGNAPVAHHRGNLVNNFDPRLAGTPDSPDVYVTAEPGAEGYVYAEGHLVGDGVLELSIYAKEARQKGFVNASGGYAFEQIVNAAEATGEMQAVRGFWVEGDNLRAFRDAGGGVGKAESANIEAAKATWTYKQAAKAGYSEISEIIVTDKMVKATFTRKVSK
ncbi:MAG: RHS repeat-associated core domain-containing protein, partial [Myxococcota bacterium]